MARPDAAFEAPSFHNSEERDRWQLRQYGHVRNGFRTEEEPRDDRPLLYEPEPFWCDETERLSYEAAKEAHPKDGDEGPLAYVQRLAAIVAGRYEAAGKPMPSATRADMPS